jgi:hypothetical protein
MPDHIFVEDVWNDVGSDLITEEEARQLDVDRELWK